MTAYIIGNGITRRNIDLKQLDGMTYGCNSLVTEFIPDVLVATDDPISTAIQRTGYAKTNRFYTRKIYHGTGALKLRPPFNKWASGPNAVQLAVMDKHIDIVLLGFDFGSKDKTMNNIYAGTDFYKDFNDKIKYLGDWTFQVRTIMEHSTKIKFTVVIGPETCDTVEILKELENVKIITSQEFINNVMEKE